MHVPYTRSLKLSVTAFEGGNSFAAQKSLRSRVDLGHVVCVVGIEAILLGKISICDRLGSKAK